MNQQTVQSTGRETFREHFQQVQDRFSQNGQAWFLNARKAAFARFNELGFPTPKDEAWKHTNLRPLTEVEFEHPQGNLSTAGELLEGIVFHQFKAHRMVFVDGRFSEAHSDLENLPKGLTVIPLTKAFSSHRELVEKHLAKYAGEDENPAFVALNTALHEDGALIKVDKGTHIEDPIHLIFLSSSHEHPHSTHPRILVVAEEGSEATLVERYVGEQGSVYFTNTVAEAVLEDNAVLDHYRLQDESEDAFHIGTVQIELARDSQYRTHAISIGSKIGRNGIAAHLNGPGIECVMNGLFLTQDEQHIDNHTRVIHAEPHCHSHEVFKGILDGHSSGAFTGRIIVKEGAQKTDAIQSSKNLLLSDDAKITPDPQLEIFADDVKCTHGATIGQLDTDAIFYLKSRGIDEQSAKGLLTYAFANEIIEQIKIEPLREYLEQIIAERYRKGVH
ncbi:MAG: Fe-S cluster assembly protein SufD [Candidatus Omnitrophica bacterium]|nr:Fe-S cluster assembly protein SufD [Candidatus Omnitrophota bacterium]